MQREAKRAKSDSTQSWPLSVVEGADFPRLIDALIGKGYRVVGPTVRDGSILYDEISSADELPVGWTEEQDGGHYRLKPRDDRMLFGYAVGPRSLKHYLLPPLQRLWRARRDNGAFQLVPETDESPRWAFLGVRSCELHAMAILDRIFLKGNYRDPAYAARREKAFLVGLNCVQAGGTCFCASMKTGPKVTGSFDLALTEIVENRRHFFVVEVGSPRGEEVLEQIPHAEASEEEKALAAQAVDRAAGQMGRQMDTTDLKEHLYRNFEHPHWEEVAERCLTCANCTLVCPTCFCTTVEDTTDLLGDHAERWRKWDSCFTMDFSYIHGGSVRYSPAARYRQWMTHKLATWIDQFGMSGCVGCGRCITWCPVGIDITEEVRALRVIAPAPKESANGDS